MSVIYIVISILGMAAIVGMYLLTLILRNKEVPKGATLIHGLMAGAAIVILICYCFIKNTTGPATSIVVLVIASISGLILNYRDLTGKKIPKWLAIGHGLVAVLGLLTLLLLLTR